MYLSIPSERNTDCLDGCEGRDQVLDLISSLPLSLPWSLSSFQTFWSRKVLHLLQGDLYI